MGKYEIGGRDLDPRPAARQKREPPILAGGGALSRRRRFGHESRPPDLVLPIVRLRAGPKFIDRAATLNEAGTISAARI